MSTTVGLGPTLQAILKTEQLELPFIQSAVARVEKLSPSNLNSFSSQAFALFHHSFPNPDEREPVEDILARIHKYESSPDADGSEFHAFVFLSHNNQVIGYSQGSIVSCGPKGMIYFWQYGCVADEAYLRLQNTVNPPTRNQGVSKIMHLINSAVLEHRCTSLDLVNLNMEVWESEPRGLGETLEEFTFSATRLAIHGRSGGKVLFGVHSDGKTLVNLYIQPRLTTESSPIVLHLMIKTSAALGGEMDKELAKSIVVQGLLENFRREGFPESDVREVEEEILKRFQDSERIVLLSPEACPNVLKLTETDALLRNQLLKLYGVSTWNEAQQKFAQYNDESLKL